MKVIERAPAWFAHCRHEVHPWVDGTEWECIYIKFCRYLGMHASAGVRGLCLCVCKHVCTRKSKVRCIRELVGRSVGREGRFLVAPLLSESLGRSVDR